MNKSEISEIKKFFTKEHCRINRICSCYVNGEKEKIFSDRQAFFSLPEEEAYKYFEIFRKTLSGSLGKNLLNMEFPLAEEKEGGKQASLLALLNSNLEEDPLLDAYYNQVIESFSYAENYLILLIDLTYDIPRKASDGTEMFDASDYVYHAILSSLCPVSLSKPGLSYNVEGNRIEDRVRDWVVQMPEIGFLFPAFNDRNTDLHSVLFYSKNPALPNRETAELLLGLKAPIPAAEQKEAFNTIVEQTLGKECSFDAVRSIHENLTELLEENKDVPDPVTLSKGDVTRLLSVCGAPDDTLDTAGAQFEEAMGEKVPILATNITSTRNFEVKMPEVTVNVKPGRTDLIETREIDGRKYLLIEITDEVTVNGIHIQ